MKEADIWYMHFRKIENWQAPTETEDKDSCGLSGEERCLGMEQVGISGDGLLSGTWYQQGVFLGLKEKEVEAEDKARSHALGW